MQANTLQAFPPFILRRVIASALLDSLSFWATLHESAFACAVATQEAFNEFKPRMDRDSRRIGERLVVKGWALAAAAGEQRGKCEWDLRVWTTKPSVN